MTRVERELLLERLRVDAARIADHFELDYRSIEAEHPRVKSRYGVCYQDGLIKVRLNHAKTGKPLKYSSLIDTVCHELAHLRHFDHSPAFKAFFFRLLNWARQQGIYQPAPKRPASEAQSAAAPRPAPELKPSCRNGVPVFVEPERRSGGVLPWQRLGPPQTELALATAAVAPAATPPRPQRRAPVSRGAAGASAARARRQLSLFD